MAKNRLGRGLDALLPNIENYDELVIKELPIEDIDPNKEQPRQVFNQESLAQLAESIKVSGVIAPIIVVEEGNRYKIVAGERRYRAARLADLHTLPCIIRDMSESEILQTALIENLQREDLNPMDEAEAINHIMQRFNYNQESIANILGKSRSAVTNSLRLLNLNEAVKNFVRDKSLSFGHAKVIAGVDNKDKQKELAELSIKQGLSVRQLEEYLVRNKNQSSKIAKIIDADLKAFELNIKQVFGLKTKLSGNQNKGKIVLSYNSKEELDNLFDIIKELS